MRELPLIVKVLVVSLLFLMFMTDTIWAKTADELYWRGYEYDALGNYYEAIKYYKQAIVLRPDFSDAHFRLGLLYEVNGMFDQAIDQYLELIAIDPDYADVHYNLGVAYDRKGSLSEAIAAYKKVIVNNKNHFDARKNLCSACTNNGLLDDALMECQKLIAIDPTCTTGYLKLGMVFFNKGMYALSVRHYVRALSLYLQDLCKTVFLVLKSSKALLRYLNFNLL